MDFIIGQEKAVTTLKDHLESGLKNHAYLFLGPSGVGKYTTAVRFAHHVLCENNNACGECRHCKLLENKNHPDFIIIQPTGDIIKSIKIDQVRDIINLAQTAPYEGKYRVFIIDNAQLMNPQAANCLLKTLEEPYPGNILILTSPVMLMPTVMSRLQTIRFQKLTLSEVEEGLTVQGHDTKYASLADGSIGKAIEMANGSTTEINDIIEIKDTWGALKKAEELAKDKAVALKKLIALQYWLRDILYFRETGEILIYPDYEIEIKDATANMDSGAVIKKLRKVFSAIKGLEGNGNTKLILEDVFLTLTY